MDQRRLFLIGIVAATASLAFSGCGANATPAATGYAAQTGAHAVPKGGSAALLAVSSCGTCAGHGTNAEYYFKPGKATPERTVSIGVAAPWVGLLFNGQGDLFVANCTSCVRGGSSGVNNVVEYPTTGNTPSLTITNGITYPFDLVQDRSATLYVSNLGCQYTSSTCGQISEYGINYRSGAPTKVISVTYPLGMVFDSKGNLYVANCVVCATGDEGSDDVLVYAPGATSPSRAITDGINEPFALAMDSNDNLYVSNCINCGQGAAKYVGGTDTVTEYATGSSTPLKTIYFTNNVDVPFSLAIDPSNHLYVGNRAVSTVTEYSPDTDEPSKTISAGIHVPEHVTVDAHSVLYVSNYGNGTVTEYSRHYSSGPPSATLTVASPTSLAVSDPG